MLLRLALPALATLVAAVGANGSLAAGVPGGKGSPRPALRVAGDLPSLPDATPGERRSGTLVVSNEGGASGTLELDLTAQGSRAARSEFLVTMRDGGRIVFRSPLEARLSVPLGVIAHGQSRVYRVTLELSPGARIQGVGARYSARFLASS